MKCRSKSDFVMRMFYFSSFFSCPFGKKGAIEVARPEINVSNSSYDVHFEVSYFAQLETGTHI